MKKILVVGAKGMAGHVVKSYLASQDEYEVWGVARGDYRDERLINLDVSNTDELNKLIIKHQFDVVINCIGILNKTAEDNPEIAVWYNSYFPHLLESWAKKTGFKLIHISTDCVFSGKEGGYTENSFKNGIGFYAQSKALGEVINSTDLTFRTSIIGPELKNEGIGLFHWFMNQNGIISGYKEAFWTGVTTIELAKAIDEAIKQDLKGLYHLVNNEKISKYDLLKLLNTIFKGSAIEIKAQTDYRVDKSLINNRPDFKYQVPTYLKMLEEMHLWVKSHAEIYPNYK